jgi:hypothetical protein
MHQGKSWARDYNTTLPNESSEKGKQVLALEKGGKNKNQEIIIKDLIIVTIVFDDAFVALAFESKDNIRILDNRASNMLLIMLISQIRLHL